MNSKEIGVHTTNRVDSIQAGIPSECRTELPEFHKP